MTKTQILKLGMFERKKNEIARLNFNFEMTLHIVCKKDRNTEIFHVVY